MPRVLIVEDDDAMRDMVGYALADEGMEIEAVADGESALELFSSSGPFDLVILDVMLPGVDGITVCKELTSVSDVPVIMLTARDDEMSVVVGLEVGADDYITKPFSHRELVSRVRATLRRRRIDARASSKQERLEFPGLAIDLARRQVDRSGHPRGPHGRAVRHPPAPRLPPRVGIRPGTDHGDRVGHRVLGGLPRGGYADPQHTGEDRA